MSVRERKDEFNALLALSYWLLAPPPGESARSQASQPFLFSPWAPEEQQDMSYSQAAF